MHNVTGEEKVMTISVLRWLNVHFLGYMWSTLGLDSGKLGQDKLSPDHYVRRPLIIIRYLLFVVSSVFYLAGPLPGAIYFKLVVILTMLVAVFLARDLYDNWDYKLELESMQSYVAGFSTETAKKHKRLSLFGLIIGETIGIALLILPTGGLDSPFVWYVLNPILAAAIFLPWFYSWATLILFMIAATAASSLYPGMIPSFTAFVFKHWSLFMVFFVATALTQVAVSLYKQLIRSYQKLSAAHAATEHAFQHIASLYQALEAFSSQEDWSKLAEVLALYTSRLCARPAACYLKKHLGEELQQDGEPVLHVVDPDGLCADFPWEKELVLLLGNIENTSRLNVYAVKGGNLMVRPIKAHGECFGLLAFLDLTASRNQHQTSGQDSLRFLSELGAIILERLKVDQLWGRLLVSEEQNRIANEIHDGVSQYLFSIVCAAHAMAGKDNISMKVIREQFKLIEATAGRASQELRASIYQLSPYKRGETIFLDKLASFLDELGRLNGIHVDLEAEGSEEVLSPALRKGLYRIVREASSNALRHGKCSSLHVSLSMSPVQTILEIRDNGCGYQAYNHIPAAAHGGLGIQNMQHLATRFNGAMEIHSQLGQGTLIRCSFPKRMEENTGT